MNARSWATAHRKWIVVGVVVAIVISALAFCRPKPTPLPKKDQFSFDSSKATKPDADSIRRAAIDSATRAVAKIVADSAKSANDSTSRIKDREIARLHRIADSAIAVASSPAMNEAPQLAADRDAWKTAAEARTSEVEQVTAERDTARAERDTARHDLVLAHATINDLTTQVRRDEARIAASETPKTGLNDRLAHDVVAGDRCRIFWVFGCPSRLASVGLGVAGDELVRLAYRERARLGISISF